jgi:hypothetical protein
VYVTDTGHAALRKISPNGEASTLPETVPSTAASITLGKG